MTQTHDVQGIRRRRGRPVRASLSLALFAVAALLAAACDEGPKSPVGSYALSSVDAKRVPVALASAVDYKFEIVSGTLEIGADSSYVSVTRLRETVQGHESIFVDTVQGIWVQDNKNLSFTAAGDNSAMSGSWSRASVTMVFVDGDTRTAFVYAR